MATDPESLIIFDYSGTLSLAAPQFARPDNLSKQLAESGLSAFGIDGPDAFWNKIVNPTWEPGSTTTTGYATLMANRIRDLQDGGVDGGPSETAVEAAARFVRAYLAHSAIDPRWEPLLAWLSSMPAVLTLIATDHYAEATDAIVAHLNNRHLEAIPLRDIRAQGRQEGKLIIANSADLGVHKANGLFWETVRTRLSLTTIRRILTVDDWGANEQSADAYGMPSRIAARRSETIGMLESVFHAPVTAADFIVDNPGHDSGVLIERVTGDIAGFLGKDPHLEPVP